MSEPKEVMVVNADHWIDHILQLAQLLRTASEHKRPAPITDPTGSPPDPETMATVVDPGYWSDQHVELRDALAGPASGGATGIGRTAAAAGTTTPERLTLTVEEAAALLGISRAFAYEAVRRGEIPSIRIGRRVLVPRAALHRLVDVAAGDPEATGEVR